MKRKTSLRPTPTALLSPRCDPSFKAMFTADTDDSNAALRDFISTVLSRPVESVELLPNEPVVDIIDENKMSFDVSARFDGGERVDLEMQARERAYDYAARAEIQVARLLSTGNKRGDEWESPNAYQISVLNFSFGGDDTSPLAWYTMRDGKGAKLAGKLNVLFFDLVKIHRLLGTPPDKLTKLEKWGLFLSYAGDERYEGYIDGIAGTEDGIMSAKSALSMVSQDDINWARQNTIYTGLRDYNSRENHLKRLADEVARGQKEVEFMRESLERVQATLACEKEVLSRERSELSRERNELFRNQEELSRERNELSREQSELFRNQEELSRCRDALSRNQNEFARSQAEFSQKQEMLARGALRLGLPVEQVAEICSLPPDELAALRDELSREKAQKQPGAGEPKSS